MLTTTAYDPKTAMIERLRMTGETYVADLSFIPADKLGLSPMGAARPPLEFTAECAGFNLFVAALADGETPARRTDEERAAFEASVNSFETAKQVLMGSVDKLISALERLDEEGIHRAVQTPWGQETTILGMSGMAATHMSYHDGQINYIQALYGDADNHWGG